VKFENNALYIEDKGKKEFAVYANELNLISDYFQSTTREQQEEFVRFKKIKKLKPKQLDSLAKLIKRSQRKIVQTKEFPLKGYRIAIDPGHFSTNLLDAQTEQKFLYFVPDSINAPSDTVKIFESFLTYNTAHILKNLLEEKGADVLITRTQPDFTSFNCTFQDWMMRYRKRTLDSLFQNELISPEKYKKLLKCDTHTFFWDFFRDYDLANRSNKINAYKPDVSVIIHFNVDEKNAPWKQHSQKNFSMAFIGGAFVEANLNRTENKMDFIRLLLSDQLNRSEKLAVKTVSNFNKLLKIPIAQTVDADYLKDNCLITASPGVFCRNLALCRKINSPLVYGESLYQDNEKETILLMRSDMDIYGIRANERVYHVALSYYDALSHYLSITTR
jgi:N-acetylmuramoyl-L-alanine amidase